MSNLVEQAHKFAQENHKSQNRKYTGDPYFNHCLEVHNIFVQHFPKSSDVLRASCLLHDVVEDTDVNHQAIYNEFGPEVFDIVFYLTDISKPEDGARHIRKMIDRMHLISSYDPCVYYIKCADMISNTSSIVKHDPKFSKIYLKEKKLMLDEMAAAIPQVKVQDIYQMAYHLSSGVTNDN